MPRCLMPCCSTPWSRSTWSRSSPSSSATEGRPRAASRVAMLVAFVLVLAGVAFAWRYTPLREWADFRQVLALIERVDDMPLAPAYADGRLRHRRTDAGFP
ncbi:hypothetical protein ACTMU2_35010 [Cupriavidus basilensis]